MRIITAVIAIPLFITQLPTAKSAQPLRIATFNAEILTAPGIETGAYKKYRWDEARVQQFERVAAVIEAINPDILNLVEVTSKEGVEYLVRILHEKGLTQYQGYHVENHDDYTSMDVALISKIAPDVITGNYIHTFFSEENDLIWRQKYTTQGRNGESLELTAGIPRHVVYYITIGEHKLGFLGLHLKSNPSSKFANDRRSAQSIVAQRILQKEIVSRNYLPIVLGDINDFDPDVPDQDDSQDTQTNVVRNLKDFDYNQEGDELDNVARLIPRVADRYTAFWDRNENGVRDPYDVFSMLDHIFLPKQYMPYVKRAFIFHSIALETSDHYAVVVDLVLP